MFLRVGREDIKVALKDTGTILLYAGLSFLIPIVLAVLLDKNPDTLFNYAVSALGLFSLGYLLRKIKVKKDTETKHAMLSIVLIWLFFCFFASLPFVFIMKVSLLDAFFETMSTLTTTGLSVMIPLLDGMPLSLIFWRTFLGWVGGIGIVLMAFIGLMTTYSKTTKLLVAEGHGDQLKENLKISAKKITFIYILLTILGIALLIFSGQTLWQATNYSMSAISTNGMDISTIGLSAVNNGWAAVGLNNYWVALSLIFIMVMGSMSFALHYLFLRKKNWLVYVKDPEFRLLLLIGFVGTLIVATKIGLLNSFFHTFSLLTCGGFALVLPEVLASWPEFVKFLWVPIVIIGGAAGSTAGGIKLSRTIIFVKSIYWRIKKELLPNGSYFQRQYNGEKISGEQVKTINQFILLWLIFIGIGVLVISAYGYPLADVLFEVASAQSNAGISTGITTALAPVGVKIMLIINMFVGRLEIIPIMASIGLLLSIKGRKRKK
jgi:trk system potassium uptake protein